MGSVDDDQIERLSEQVRELNSTIASLTRDNSNLIKENTNLKERLSPCKLDVSQHIFTVKGRGGPTFIQKDTVNDVVELGGVNVKLCIDGMPDSDGIRQQYVWFELDSPTEHNATIRCQMAFCKDPVPANPVTTAPTRFEFVHLRGGTTTITHRMPVDNWMPFSSPNNVLGTVNLVVNFKMSRSTREDKIIFDEEECVDVQIGDETIPVNAGYLSAWSDHFRTYFTSPMIESQEGIYPVEGYSSIDFREMLDVIYPTSKPITVWNVEKMIDMADRFIMPALTNLCESFLSDRSKSNFTYAKLLTLADKYRLSFLKAIVIDRMTPTMIRSKVLNTEEYKGFSEEMKRSIEARYVEADFQDRGTT
ncbi:hypothetical protein PFISCL1PPCAC_24445 [Pristionchus fissidentatus]|uniref:BTB domain-containing protein n=1 Tax=Pristionchus fissidentatus TaxID=1538716 RepID=A0AAV5WSB4_9BILA|nr:hypothetical protein PFISCL1PPCAC_24445 [Pristionchus fissidentatus]